MSKQTVNEYRLLTLVSAVLGDSDHCPLLFLTTDGRVGVPLKLIIRWLSDAPWNSSFFRGKLLDNLSFS